MKLMHLLLLMVSIKIYTWVECIKHIYLHIKHIYSYIVEVIQGCDEMAAEVTIAHDSEETVSGDDTICTDNNAEYGTYNDDENIIVVKTEPDDDYEEE